MSLGVFSGLFAQRTMPAPPVAADMFAQDEVTANEPVDRSFEFALDALPCNAMFCDRDLILRYINKSSRKTLLTLQQHLPLPVDELIGKPIHVMHRNPARIDEILGTKGNKGGHRLPHKATIELGPVKSGTRPAASSIFFPVARSATQEVC